MPSIERAAMQPSRRRQVEMGRHAARFQEHGRETVETRGLFGDPQRVRQLFRLRNQQAGGIHAVEKADARWIGKTRLAKAFGHADPKKRGGCPADQQADEGQREGSGGARVACAGCVDFGQTHAGQAAVEHRVESLDASGENIVLPQAVPSPQMNIPVRRIAEPFSEAAFDLCDPTAQGRNGFPRHGWRSHDGVSS
jgi:hypothetical protein